MERKRKEAVSMKKRGILMTSTKEKRGTPEKRKGQGCQISFNLLS